MTSIFMVFETSASYVIILPVMVANTIAYFISRRLHPVPFFTMLARQEGIDLPSAEEYRSTELLRVEDAMRPLPAGMLLDQAPAVYPDVTLDAALRLLADHPLLCVAHRDHPESPIGVLSFDDVQRAYGFAQGDPQPDTAEVPGKIDH
jgi:CIC family chloride channel protein